MIENQHRVGPTWADPRVRVAMYDQLAKRDEIVAGGGRQIGWKLAFGTPSAAERWGISGPAVGFLTDATRLLDGDHRSIADWVEPRLEAEIIVRVAERDGRLIPGGLGVAIELADLGRSADDLEDVIAGNIFHRAVIAGPIVLAEEAAGDLVVRVSGDGGIVSECGDPAGAVGGTAAELTSYVAQFLRSFGEELHDGDLLLTGAVVPPIDCSAGGVFRVECANLGAVQVRLSGRQGLTD